MDEHNPPITLRTTLAAVRAILVALDKGVPGAGVLELAALIQDIQEQAKAQMRTSQAPDEGDRDADTGWLAPLTDANAAAETQGA